LTAATSLGFDAVEFADWVHERIVAIANDPEDPRPELLELAPRLLEWQRWFLIHALELLPGPGAIFRFRTVLLLVARQNGKTTLIVYLILWRMFQDGCRLTVGSAQTLEIAQEAWDNVVSIAEAIPELDDEIKKVSRTNGKQALVLETRERYKVASSKGGGRGLTGDMVVLDELREHKTWQAWAALSKTTMARERAQVLGVSNAGDLDAVVLRSLRQAAIDAIEGRLPEVPEDVADLVDAAAVGLFEWSAGEDELGQPRSVFDRDGWAQANPSLGYTIQEPTILAAALSDPDWVFRAEVMCEFVNTAASGPFPNGAWDRTRVTAVTRDTTRPACYCLDLSHDRKMLHIALAYWDLEGRKRVEIVASRAGTEWAIPWLLNPARKVKADLVTFQRNGAPVSSLLDDFENAGFEIEDWSGPNLARWTGVFYDAIRGHTLDDEEPDLEAPLTLTHGVQPVLDVAASTARVKPLGDGWVIDRKSSPEDAAPLVAAIGAVGLLNTNPVVPGPSIYEERGLVVL